MLLQRAGTGTIPPPDFIPPPWSSFSAAWDAAPQPKFPTVTLGPATISLGHDDPETDGEADCVDVEDHAFGWDNEHPKREVHVDEFRIEWRPVTNGQFYDFYLGSGKDKVQLPATWVYQGGEIAVNIYSTSILGFCRWLSLL
jgi:formylglycine-generating enzyme required for sulfatase activity